MANYGIKIAKEGFSVQAALTEATKKNYIILDSTEAHKVFHKGFVTSGSYTHNLGYVPDFFCFETDSTSSPTYFSPVVTDVKADDTEITGIPNPSYIVIFYEGDQ